MGLPRDGACHLLLPWVCPRHINQLSEERLGVPSYPNPVVLAGIDAWRNRNRCLRSELEPVELLESRVRFESGPNIVDRHVEVEPVGSVSTEAKTALASKIALRYRFIISRSIPSLATGKHTNRWYCTTVRRSRTGAKPEGLM